MDGLIIRLAINDKWVKRKYTDWKSKRRERYSHQRSNYVLIGISGGEQRENGAEAIFKEMTEDLKNTSENQHATKSKAQEI